MHDRALRPAGTVKSAAAVASEMMILLNIDLRIAQVRPRVEECVHGLDTEAKKKHFSPETFSDDQCHGVKNP